MTPIWPPLRRAAVHPKLFGNHHMYCEMLQFGGLRNKSSVILAGCRESTLGDGVHLRGIGAFVGSVRCAGVRRK